MGKTMGLSAVAGATALLVAVRQSSAAVAELSMQAKMAGVSFEAFQELKYVAEQNLVGVDALTDGLKELSLRADEFILTGSGSASDAFKRLGYSAAELKEKLNDPAQLFSEIIERLGTLDRAAQIRISDEVFGGSGGEQFVALIDAGADGLARGAAEARNLGIILSEETAAKAEELNRAFQTVTTTVTAGLQQAIVNAGYALYDFLQQFMAVENRTTAALEIKASDIKAGIAARQRALDEIEAGTRRRPGGNTLASDNEADAQALAQINAELERRRELLEVTPPGVTVPPKLSGTGFATGSDAEADKVKELITSLRDEQAIMREMDPVQKQMLAMREQLTAATPRQREEVEGLVRSLQQEAQAWAGAQAAGQFFGDMMIDSLEGLRQGTKSLTEVLDDMINALAQAVLQSMLLGQGPLAGLFGTKDAGGGIGGMTGGLLQSFAGPFAKGGLIPNGTFGIVGERGPEMVSATAGGAQVTSNSSLADMLAPAASGGPMQVIVQGSGLTQAEMTQAIADAFESFDRHTLPRRVNEITNDPLATG
jgi:hypothetical protein